MMRINEVCKKLGLTKKAVLYYEKRGLIKPSKDDNGYRFFDRCDIERLEEIDVYRKLGISTLIIEDILGCSSKDLYLKAIEEEMNQKLQEIIKRQYIISKLNEKGASINSIKNIINSLSLVEESDKDFVIKKLHECFPTGIGDFLMKKQLDLVALSYDKGIDLGIRGINLYEELPEYITSHPSFDKFKELNGLISDSKGDEIRVYLDPQENMRMVDLGCCLNLMFNGYDKWRSLYHGVDISKKTIQLLDEYIEKNGIEVGSLECCSIHETPYEDEYFDIAACIGVLEYFDEYFLRSAIHEMYRILKSEGRLVLDVPNLDSPISEVTMMIEEYMGRENKFDISNDQFEAYLREYFRIIKVEEVAGMLQYFLQKK